MSLLISLNIMQLAFHMPAVRLYKTQNTRQCTVHEAYSHCCRGKAKYYMPCVFPVIQHAMRMSHIVIRGLPAVIFYHSIA